MRPVYFFEIMSSDPFRKWLSELALDVRSFLERALKVGTSAFLSIYEIMKKKADTGTKPLKKPIFDKGPDPILKYIGTEQVRYIHRASLSLELYGHDSRTNECKRFSSASSEKDITQSAVSVAVSTCRRH